MLHDSAWAAISKHHRLDGLNNRHAFLTVLDAGKSKVMVLADSVLSEVPLPGLQMVSFSLCANMVERGSSGVSS